MPDGTNLHRSSQQTRARAPEPFPAGIRVVAAADRQRLIDYLIENYGLELRSFGSLDVDAVEQMVDRAIDRRGVVIAFVENAGEIEAVIGFMPARPWWGKDDSWYWTELFVNVAPRFRRSRNFYKLERFARWFAASVPEPVLIHVLPAEGLLRKLRAFLRWGRMIGGIFQVGGGSHG